MGLLTPVTLTILQQMLRQWENRGEAPARERPLLLRVKSFDTDNAYVTKSKAENNTWERISHFPIPRNKHELLALGQVWHHEMLHRVFSWVFSFLGKFHLSLQMKSYRKWKRLGSTEAWEAAGRRQTCAASSYLVVAIFSPFFQSQNTTLWKSSKPTDTRHFPSAVWKQHKRQMTHFFNEKTETFYIRYRWVRNWP